jgi:O-antigen/teichoic acid export membrane protein
MPGTADTQTDVLSGPGVAARTARGAGLRLASYAAGTALSVASAAVLLRYLGVTDYGRYAAVFALVTIVGGVTEASTANVGVRELSVRPRREHDDVLAALQGMRLTLTAGGVAAAMAFALAAGWDEEMVAGTAVAGAGLLLTVFAITLWVPLQAELRLGRVALLELLRQALTVAALLAAVAAGAGLVVLLGAQIPVALALAVAGLAAAGAPLRALRPAAGPGAWRDLLRETIPYTTATAIGLVYSSSVVLVMSIVASEHETGLYGAASRIFVVLAGTASVLVGSAFPVLARAGADDRERLRLAFGRLFDAFAVAGAGLALVAAAGAPVAIDVIAGAEFADAAATLQVLAAALLGSFFLALGAFTLLSLGRQRLLIVANGSGLALCAALALWLTPGHGAGGGAVATVAGETLIAVVTLAALARAGVTASPRALPRVLAATGLAALPAFALGLPALPATVLAAVVFAGAALVLGLVPAEVRPGRRPGGRAGARL